MALTIPDLDDRTYASLLEAARDAISVHSEEWTDHNVHDPGITILELLAWVAESDIYSLDRLTDEHRLKYLKLLGVTPRSPQSARATLELALPRGTRGATVPAGSQLFVNEPGGADLVFQTDEPVTLTAATLERVVSEHGGGRSDNTTANDTLGVSYLAFGEDARPDSALYLGFDADPFAAVGSLDLTVSFHEEVVPAPESHGPEQSEFEPTVGVVWEYCTDYSEWYLDVWRPFDVRSDGTNSLYRSGTVRVDRPVDWTGRLATATDSVLEEETRLVWLRCRPVWPPGDDVGHEVPPHLDAVTVNTVTAVHREGVTDEVLTRPDGGIETTAVPDQRFEFASGSVLERPEARADVELLVGVGDPQGVLDVAWEQVRDFDASGPDDRHFVVDHAGGAVQFGDGNRGTVPEPGRRVLATEARYGGGTDGNVSASATWQFTENTVERAGVYKYACESNRKTMRGAILVGDADTVPVADVDGWLADIEGDATLVDRQGQREVTVTVGSAAPDEPLTFTPAALRVDPGTVVRFEWLSDSLTVDVESQPPDGTWEGHPESAYAGFVASHTFESSLELSQVRVDVEGRAAGGRDAESVDDALFRLREDLRRRYRAVTVDDWVTLATTTPGLRFGRAAAVVEPESETGGVCERDSEVRITIVPFSTRDRPVPTTGFLNAVRCHLERHRLVTDRFEVEPPTYVGVGVTVEVRIESGYGASERADAIDDRLREFLHPLTGFEGEGWPFGRPVYLSELYEVAESVDGVDCVLDVDVTASGSTASYRDGGVTIGEATLVYSMEHEVVVRADGTDCGVGV